MVYNNLKSLNTCYTDSGPKYLGPTSSLRSCGPYSARLLAAFWRLIFSTSLITFAYISFFLGFVFFVFLLGKASRLSSTQSHCRKRCCLVAIVATECDVCESSHGNCSCYHKYQASKECFVQYVISWGRELLLYKSSYHLTNRALTIRRVRAPESSDQGWV